MEMIMDLGSTDLVMLLVVVMASVTVYSVVALSRTNRQLLNTLSAMNRQNSTLAVTKMSLEAAAAGVNPTTPASVLQNYTRASELQGLARRQEKKNNEAPGDPAAKAAMEKTRQKMMSPPGVGGEGRVTITAGSGLSRSPQKE